jgi:hypothetical protein
VGVYKVGTERVSGCIYGGNIESERVVADRLIVVLSILPKMT